MLLHGDPLSQKRLDIARRMAAFIRQSTCCDKELWNSGARFWQEAVCDPRTVAQLPMKKAHWDFTAKAFAELQRRGELKP